MTCKPKHRLLYICAGCVSLFYLSGCAAVPPPDPKIVYRDAPVAVSVACKPDPAPARPDFVVTPEALSAAPNVAEKARLYAIERLQRIGYEKQLEAALLACEGP